MKTSSFTISGKDSNAVSIAQWPPKWYKDMDSREYKELAPEPYLVNAWCAQRLNTSIDLSRLSMKPRETDQYPNKRKVIKWIVF